MALVVTVAPGSEPITLAEVKAHARIETSADDSLISALIVAARQVAEQELGRPIISTTYKLTLDAFPDYTVDLAAGLASVTSVKYYDTSNAQQTLDPSAYFVDITPLVGGVSPASAWPATYVRPSAVEIVFVAGWTNAAAVPQAVKQWLLMRVASMYESRADHGTQREAASVALPFVAGLLDPYRVPVL